MMKKLLALLMALMMMGVVALAEAPAVEEPATEQVTAEAPAAEEAAPAADTPAADAAPLADDAVLATVGEQKITYMDVKMLIPRMKAAQVLEDETDIRSVTDQLVRQTVIEAVVKEKGLDQFTLEEEAAFANEAKAEWDKALDSYVSYHLSEDTPEARAKLREEAATYFAMQGDTEASILVNIKKVAAVDKLRDQLVAGYEPTDDEINKVFQDVGKSYQDEYENNIMSYEYMTNYYGQEPWYTPTGYRGILHVLLKVDQELLTKYTALQAKLEEGVSDKGAEATEGGEAKTDKQEEPVTQEMVDQARQAVIDSKKAEIDAIYEAVKAGTPFVDLIAKYGEDPGMQDEQRQKDGYAVHQNSVVWDPAFTKAAFSDKMQKVGDVSDPAVGSFGIHILYYLRDIPSGLHMTDTIRTQIHDYLVKSKENEAFKTAYEEWAQKLGVVMDDNLIEQATMAAQAGLKTTQMEPGTENDQPLEAVPQEQEKTETTTTTP